MRKTVGVTLIVLFAIFMSYLVFDAWRSAQEIHKMCAQVGCGSEPTTISFPMWMF